jgi:hypothetical protein
MHRALVPKPEYVLSFTTRLPLKLPPADAIGLIFVQLDLDLRPLGFRFRFQKTFLASADIC